MSEWINCTDLLPEEGKLIAFLDSKSTTMYGMPLAGIYFNGEFWISSIGTASTKKYRQISGVGSLKITHWMPLPEPPED